MPDHFQVYPGEAPRLVAAEPTMRRKITNGFGGPLLYKNAPDVSASDKDGSLTGGGSVTTAESLWVRAGGATAKVVVEPVDPPTGQRKGKTNG